MARTANLVTRPAIHAVALLRQTVRLAPDCSACQTINVSLRVLPAPISTATCVALAQLHAALALVRLHHNALPVLLAPLF
jgi:hypothetical protein